MSTPLTFLHLSDPHLSGLEAGAADDALGRLTAALARARTLQAAFIVITGDLADRGADAAYDVLAAALAAAPCPVFLALGNHDARPAFRAVFAPEAGAAPHAAQVVTAPHSPTNDSPWCVAETIGGLNVIVLDTLVPGRTGGALSAEALAFLDAALAQAPNVPALLCLHHPPAMGQPASWDSLDAASTEALAARLPGAVTAVLAGHIHRDRCSLWHGVPVLTTAGLAYAIDPLETEALSVCDGASLSLLRWTPDALQTTIVSLAPPRQERARIDPSGLLA